MTAAGAVETALGVIGGRLAVSVAAVTLAVGSFPVAAFGAGVASGFVSFAGRPLNHHFGVRISDAAAALPSSGLPVADFRPPGGFLVELMTSNSAVECLPLAILDLMVCLRG